MGDGFLGATGRRLVSFRGTTWHQKSDLPRPKPFFSDGLRGAGTLLGAEPGERAVFFLNRDGGAYGILGAGRGKLAVTKDGRDVTLFSRDDYHFTKALSDACKGDECPLAAVLKDIAPFLADIGPTAFIIGTDSNTTTVSSKDVRCAPTENGGLREGCVVGGGNDAGALSPMTTDLVCFSQKRGRLGCFIASVEAPGKSDGGR